MVRIIARLNVGGPSIHVTLLTAGMRSSRFTTTLVAGTENPGEGSMLDFALDRGVRPVVVPEIVGEASLKPRDLKALLAVYRLIRRERPQIVHTHTAKAGFVGRVAAKLAGVPVIVHTYHGHVLHGYYTKAKTEALRRMEQTLAAISTHLVAVSEQVRADLVSYGVAPAKKISVVPLGLELDAFLRADALRGSFCRELGLPENARLVGIVGRIFPVKNHALFLDAARRVAAELPQTRFVVVGDGKMRAEMEDLARILGIAGNVIFTGWRRDTPRILADLDLLAVSSNNEGTPVSAIEAMAAGVPVVATCVGGLPDLVDNGRTGLLVPPQNAEALAAAMLRVLRDEALARRLRQAAREEVRARFDACRLVADVEALYGRLLNSAPQPAAALEVSASK